MKLTRMASMVCGKHRGAELVLAVVGQDGVLQEQQRFLGKSVDGPGGLAHHVATHQDVPDQTAFLGVAAPRRDDIRSSRSLPMS